MTERAEDLDAWQDALEQENDKVTDRIDAQIQQAMDYLNDNSDLDRPATVGDALEYLGHECGMQPDGSCTMAGSEDCDECIFQG